MVRALDLSLERSLFQVPAVALASRNLTQVVCTRLQADTVQVKGWRCLAAGKVTAGLASHWPHVTDFSGLSTPTGLLRPKEGR